MWLWIFACAAQVGLSEEGQSAKLILQDTLEDRVAEPVSRAARQAAQWQGSDPDLDRLLGDALANVLMKPSEGLELLRANPAPESQPWRNATLSAALRLGDRAVLRSVREEVHDPGSIPNATLMEQLAGRARMDPALSWTQLSPYIDACALLDQRPTRGRQSMDLPSSPALAEAARALGATIVATGRPPASSDPDPLSGRGKTRCENLVLLPGTDLPERIPRTLIMAAQDAEDVLFIDIREMNGEPWLIASSDAKAAARWYQAASILARGGSVAEVQSQLGTGLNATLPGNR